MSALLYPVHRTNKDIKWGLVAHTVAMLVFSTIPAAINRNVLSISYIDNREFPGGSIEYKSILNSTQVFVSVVMFPFNQWLADGLLVSSAPGSATVVSNVGRCFSCIVAMLFIQ
jgi:hypothetical protein